MQKKKKEKKKKIGSAIMHWFLAAPQIIAAKAVADVKFLKIAWHWKV